jgi:hypothetical protein
MNNIIISLICSDESRIKCFLSSNNINIKYNENNILCVEINNEETTFFLGNNIIKKNIKNSSLNKIYKFYIFSYTLNKINLGNGKIDYFFSCDNILSIKKIKEIEQNNKIIILPCSHPTRSTNSPCDGRILYTAYYRKGNINKDTNIEWKYYLDFYKEKQQCRNTNFLLEAMEIIRSLDLINNRSIISNSVISNSTNSTSKISNSVISNLTNSTSIISNPVNSNLTNNRSIISNPLNPNLTNSRLLNKKKLNSNLINNESGYLANTESIISNTKSINLNNQLITSNPTNNTEDYKKKIKYYYILGLGCSKNETKKIIYKNYFLKVYNNTNIDRDVTIICKSFHKAIFTIAKRLVGLPPSNSEYLLKIQEAILADLKKYKEVIICGHSYGGSIIARIAKNLNKNKNILYDKLKMYTFGSIYIPREELDNINIIHFMNLSDISLRLSKTNYNELIKNNKKITGKIDLPIKWDNVKIIKYFISNNKQIFYINLIYNSKINNTHKRSLLSISNEWHKHNDYYCIEKCILNSNSLRTQLSTIINNLKK